MEGGGTKYEVSPTEPDRVFGEPRKSIFGPDKEVAEKEFISKSPMGDEMWNTTVRDDTDELDTPDRWAFLDENMAKKKKLARGHALMEAPLSQPQQTLPLQALQKKKEQRSLKA